jgi:hypothetical protein
MAAGLDGPTLDRALEVALAAAKEAGERERKWWKRGRR